ncbi:MAG: rusA [Gemmatimonadetes bacterium]|nr:rusA [Gemmatimonadota bacterium]
MQAMSADLSERFVVALQQELPTELRHTLTLPEPPSANRWWRMVVVGKQARMLLSSEARAYKARIGLIVAPRIDAGPIRVSIDWYRGRRSGDLDKRLGVVLDALQGVLYTNDAQIVELVARRFDDPGNARIVVTAEPALAVQPSLTLEAP